MKRTSDKKDALVLVLLSDSHELHREIEVPDGDILIHSGDFTMLSHSLHTIIDFNEWLRALPHRHKVVVPGNHELYRQSLVHRSLISNAQLLINEGVEIEGLRVWGSPITPVGPAFGVRSAQERRWLYSSIPQETDVLITHGPPFGILDCNPGSTLHQGDRVLPEAVDRVRPRLHVFGHIHGAHGLFEGEHTTVVNAALLGPGGDLDKKPIVLRIARQ